MKKITSLTVFLLTCLMAVSLTISVAGCSLKQDKEPQSFTITYDANSGVLSENKVTVKKGDTIKLPTPTKEGYTFECWELNSAEFDVNSYAFDKNITLVAKYTANKYDVTFDNGVDGVEVTYDATYTLPDAEKAGYTFVGWKNGSANIPKTGTWKTASDVSLTAVFTANKYTVSFDNGVNSIEVTYGEAYTLPDATKTGATFVGWKNGTETIAKTGTWNIANNVSLTAVFTTDSYTVSFDNGVNSIEVTYGEAYTLPDAEKTGYTFVKWLKNGQEFAKTGTWTLTEDVALVAEFTASKYDVTFSDNVTAIEVTYGEAYTLPNAEKTGYTFVKWLKNGQEFAKTGTWTLTEDVALVAEFTANKYDVTFSDNVTAIEVTFGETYTLPNAEKTGYTFVKWLKNGQEFAKTGTWTLTEDVALVAEFVINKYTVSLNVGEGQLQAGAQSSFEVEYGANYDLTSYVVTAPAGYNFIGWYLSTDEEKVVIANSGAWNYTISNPELVAKYVEKTMVKVTLNAGEGTLVGSVNTIEFENGTEYDLTDYAVTAPEGYSFKAWTIEGEEIALTGNWDYGYGDVELVASYTANKYTVSFSDDVEPIEVTFGEAYDLPNAEKTGYTFSKWLKNGEEFAKTGTWSIAEDVALVAEFTANKYTVSFSDNVEPIEVTFGASYTLPEAEKTGYTFSKWLKNGQEFAKTGTWSIAENVALVAEFTANKYTVSFSDDVEPIEVTFGEAYTLPEAQQAGKGFVKWLNGEADIAMSGTWSIAENVTLTAVLNAKTYTVSFDSNVEPIEVVFGQEYILPTATKFGFNFVKWLNGEEEFALEGTWELDTNVSLTAQFTAKTITITLDAKEGQLQEGVESTYTITFGEEYDLTTFAVIAPESSIVNDPFVLEGWYLGETKIDAKGVWTFGDAEAVTLTANYVYSSMDDNWYPDVQ